MSNNYNIDTAAFGNESNWFFLDDPVLYLDFHDGNGLRSLGFMKIEKTWSQKLEYVKFEAGMPRSEIRRDMIRQEFTLEGTLMQFQKEVLALVMQRRVDTTDTDWNRVIIGSAVPSPVFPSAQLVGHTVDGKELRLFIRKLQIASEEISVMIGAEEYSNIPFKATALKDDAPLTTNSEWPYNATYGTQDNIAFWAWPREDSV